MRALAAMLVVFLTGPVPVSHTWFELPVTGGQATLDRFRIRDEERATALMILSRALHGANASGAHGSLAVTFTEFFGPVTINTAPTLPDGPAAVVLAPFSDALWRRVLALDDTADLFAATVKHRGALLVAAAALQSDPSARAWLATDETRLQKIVHLWPGSFVAAAPALSVVRERIAVPGGAAHEAAWTALVGTSPARPGDFLERLLARDQGRLARFFTTLARCDESTLAALVAPGPGEDASTALASLYTRAQDAEPAWDPNAHPFQLSYADLWSILHGLDGLDPAQLPAHAGLWSALLDDNIDSRREAAELLTRPRPAPAFSALVRAALDGGPRERRDRLTMLALAQRVWAETASSSDQADAVYALGQFRKFPALLLTLDRIDVTAPATWAAAVDAARRVDNGGGSAREEALALFQGALATVERATRAGSLSPHDANRVILALASAVDHEPAIATAVATWMVDTLMPALPRLTRPDRFSSTTAYESRILQAFGGPTGRPAAAIEWEGLKYTVDVAAAEHERILRIRDLVPSPGLDAAFAAGDRALLARAMMALVYAPALGDPEGPVTLSPDVVTRHAFGGALRASGRSSAWMPPQERSGQGQPWHVSGSVLGLDLALARAALRRISADEMPAIPTINLNDQLTLARTAVALRPADLTDTDRDLVADAIARGRVRVNQAHQDPAAVEALAREVAMSGSTRQTLQWTLAQSSESALALFSLRDLMWLGRGDLDIRRLAPWGVLGEAVDGRLVMRFDPPLPWDALAGRSDTGVLATQVPDLALRMAEATARLQLPAAIIPAVLLYATEDYWHDVEARFSDDWPAMTRGAMALKAPRIEDYVAALGSAGPLRPR